MAMVIGDEVVDVMRVNEQLADYLLLRPEFVVFSPSETPLKPRDKYIDGKFIARNEDEEEDPQSE